MSAPPEERPEDGRIAKVCCMIVDMFPELAMLPEGNTIVLQERIEAEILIALGRRRRPRVTRRGEAEKGGMNDDRN